MIISEVGTVMEVRPGKVLVRLERTSRCQGCKACILAGGGRFMVAEAVDRLGSGVGDRVRIESREPGQIGGGFVLYILPLLLFVVGFFAGSEAGDALGISPEGAGVGGGVLFLALSYAAIWLVYARARKRAAPMHVIDLVSRARRPSSAGAATEEESSSG